MLSWGEGTQKLQLCHKSTTAEATWLQVDRGSQDRNPAAGCSLDSPHSLRATTAQPTTTVRVTAPEVHEVTKNKRPNEKLKAR